MTQKSDVIGIMIGKIRIIEVAGAIVIKQVRNTLKRQPKKYEIHRTSGAAIARRISRGLSNAKLKPSRR